MNGAMIERSTIDERDLPAEPEQRAAILHLYTARLAHLLAMLPADRLLLSDDEQRRLRNRAVLTTVRVLTAFGEGALASDLLRRAKQSSTTGA